MLSNKMRFKTASSARVDLYDSTQSKEHTSVFGQYLPHESEPEEGLYDPGNLFDDSNSQNAKWMKRARAYMSREK